MKPFNYQNFVFDYEPYPIAVAPDFVDQDFYRRMIESFPPGELFGTFFDGKSHKKALSEIYRPDDYHRFIRRTPVYREFYEYIKGPGFIGEILECFERNHIRLGLGKAKIHSTASQLHGKPFVLLEKIRHRLRLKKGLRSRFEFSALPSDGGNIRPHTDAPGKLITLVLSVVPPGEWNPAWQGGTSVLRPKDIRKSYNFQNHYLDFDECETIKTFEYVPNQCLLFLKTFNSLHCVAPIQNPGGNVYRKTVTINITAD